uniref:Uncharacterized protein n=1 Tax=Pygocentrus nattereri TaxID=42514 RepID=A0A3B4C5B3_PYGNA
NECKNGLLVIRVHVEFLTVEQAQTGVGRLYVVQVLHSLVQSSQHDFAVRSHLRVSHNGSRTGQISKGSEIPLSPGVDDQQSSLGSDLINIHFAPDARNGTALGI